MEDFEDKLKLDVPHKTKTFDVITYGRKAFYSIRKNRDDFVKEDEIAVNGLFNWSFYVPHLRRESVIFHTMYLLSIRFQVSFNMISLIDI